MTDRSCMSAICTFNTFVTFVLYHIYNHALLTFQLRSFKAKSELFFAIVLIYPLFSQLTWLQWFQLLLLLLLLVFRYKRQRLDFYLELIIGIRYVTYNKFNTVFFKRSISYLPCLIIFKKLLFYLSFPKKLLQKYTLCLILCVILKAKF